MFEPTVICIAHVCENPTTAAYGYYYDGNGPFCCSNCLHGFDDYVCGCAVHPDPILNRECVRIAMDAQKKGVPLYPSDVAAAVKAYS